MEYRRRTVLCLLTSAWISVACLAPSAYGADTSVLVPEAAARIFGLKRAWYTQVELDRSRSRIRHVTQHISSTRKQVVFEVKYKNGKQRFSERDVNRYGEMAGIERAEKLAKDRVKQLEAFGQEPTMERIEIPEITLFVVTDSGTVHAIDGEDGRTKWVESFGNPRHPSEAAAANDEVVAVLNGVVLTVLDHQKEGKIRWQKKVVGVPGAGPAVSDRFVYVPMANGSVEYYEVDDPDKGVANYRSNGRVLTPPLVTNTNVIWQTDNGELYFGGNARTYPQVRIETGSPIVASPTPMPGNQLLVASVDGYVSCIHELTKAVIWRFSTGQSITTSPVALNDSAYVLTDDGTLFRIAAKDTTLADGRVVITGEEVWQTNRITGFLAASKTKLYCLGRSRGIEIIDADKGGRLGTLPTMTADLNILNTQTDRIFLGSRNGTIQCLHEAALDQPVFHVELRERDLTKIEKPKTPKAPAKPKSESEANPFGDTPGDATPAPAPAKPDENDPFGAGNAGNAKEPAKPAAAADDPFGSP